MAYSEVALRATAAHRKFPIDKLYTCTYMYTLNLYAAYAHVSIYHYFKTRIGRGVIFMCLRKTLFYTRIKAQAVLLMVVSYIKLNYSDSL